MSVVIETTVGDITVDLYVKERPKACLNFIKLCKLKYYNYNLFHTIQNNFLAQTGDITGEGTFSESIWGVIHGPQKRFFEAEDVPKILHSDVGLLR
jgi:peptidyl-prolyl cis-trans isomerase-like 4